MSIQATVNDDMSFYNQKSELYYSTHNTKPNNSNEQYQIRHTQYYGAEEGDESGDLCPLMLQVVLDLFDGVDYEDP
jgi:hypothetical protein